VKWGNQLHKDSKATKKCLVSTCPAICHTTVPMCEKHWNRVPLGIRNRIISNSSTEDMLDARQEAVEHIHKENIRIHRMMEEKRKRGT